MNGLYLIFLICILLKLKNFEKTKSYCDSGKWICSQNKCPRTCSVLGMGHYKTFDGKQYDLKSNCEYILVEVFYFLFFSYIIYHLSVFFLKANKSNS